MTKPQIAVRIPPSVWEKLNIFVEAIGVSKGEVVVSALVRLVGVC